MHPGAQCSLNPAPPVRQSCPTVSPALLNTCLPSPCLRTRQHRGMVRPTIKVRGGVQGGLWGIEMSVTFTAAPVSCVGSCNESESNDESIPELEEPEGAEPRPMQTQVGLQAWGLCPQAPGGP